MLRAVLAALGAGAALVTVVPAQADPVAARQVTYTVTATAPVTADIYFRDADPPTWADYSHNPYAFSPKVRVEVGPDRPWIVSATLVDPDRWAMVSATSGPRSGDPIFRCELAVDGVIVTTAEGPKGALCAIRHW